MMRARLAVLGSLAALLVACGNGSPAAAPPTTLRTGINPVAVAERDGAVWVANGGQGTVWKLDARTGRRLATVKVGDAVAYGHPCEARNIHQVPHGSFGIRMCDLPRGMTLASSGLWIVANDRESLLRVDPRTAKVVATIPIGLDGWYVAASGDDVWVSDYDDDSMVRVDARTNRAVATLTGLPHGPTQMAFAAGGLWVACSRADAMARIDLATNQVSDVVAVGHTPLPVTFAFGSVWVRNESSELDGTVSRIDPSTRHVVATIPVGMEMGRDGLDGLAPTAHGIWVAGLDMEQIDPARNRVVRHVRHTANAVVTGQSALWSIDIDYSVTRRPLS